MSPHEQSMSYASRLGTFQGYWDNNEATARQLAVCGHIYDRPPLEALEEGSRCISCSHFVNRADSIKTLEGPVSGSASHQDRAYERFSLHHPQCIRLQVRIPLDLQLSRPLTGKSKISEIRKMFDRGREDVQTAQSTGERRQQKSSLFSLPTELRLEVYSQIMPDLDKTTEIVLLNRDSSRIITRVGHDRVGRRDDTKINILCTCKTVYDEALDLLYSNITYKFESTKLLYLFLRHIGPYGRQLLKKVDIICGSREDAIAFALLESCPKLRSITIRLWRPMLLFSRAPIWIVDGVASLLQLSGLENVQFGDVGTSGKYLREGSHDARIVRRELTRRKGSEGRVRSINGTLDL